MRYWDKNDVIVIIIVMIVVVTMNMIIAIITATRQSRSAYTVRAQCVPVMTVAFPFEHDMRHVNIVAAAFASLSDSDLHCIRCYGIWKDLVRL